MDICKTTKACTHQLVTDYRYGVVSYKVSHALQPFYDMYIVRAHLSSNYSSFIHHSSLAVTSRVNWQGRRKNLAKMAMNFGYDVFLSYSTGFFNILLLNSYDMGLTALFPSEEGVLQIFIAPKIH
jgi:hypothetical protein